jgi:hypothetical protein
MDLFKWFQKPVVLDCYTNSAGLFNYAKIKKASAYIPQWWKDLPLTNNHRGHPTPTMKGCVGFVELYKQGFILPLWSDLHLELGPIGTKDYYYKFSDGRSSITVHSQEQRGEMCDEYAYQHLKFENPWAIRCEEDINFLMTGVEYNQDRPEKMRVLPGIVNFKYQHGANINVIWAREAESKTHLLEFNSPLAHLIPLTERKVELRLHLVSNEIYTSMREISLSTTFLKKYKINKNVVKENGCPFHFKKEK